MTYTVFVEADAFHIVLRRVVPDNIRTDSRLGRWGGLLLECIFTHVGRLRTFSVTLALERR
ncbi:hypothetical protein HOLleu_03744 [Holothuria leucospilota]|uniref:Uncharacterized protein n=1 Tax=Holothuria leucospilota TaxID=206669 RepID=A0A9Q1CT83_HOLLE|nr:hypothetical protein HOLleu_03744 [Holothuria leucospilota]